MKRSKRGSTEVNAGSMADIAFLLLIFFLVTTTIASDKGILLRLPPKPEEIVDIKIPERNLFKIAVNSHNKLLVKGEPWTRSIDDLKPEITKFVLNQGRDPKSSDSMKKAIISIKTDRGTNYKYFVDILDVVNASYNEMYGNRVGLTGDQFRELDMKKPDHKTKYDQARKNFPKNISIAEPTKIGGQ